jgi:hypothetical protein
MKHASAENRLHARSLQSLEPAFGFAQAARTRTAAPDLPACSSIVVDQDDLLPVGGSRDCCRDTRGAAAHHQHIAVQLGNAIHGT